MRKNRFTDEQIVRILRDAEQTTVAAASKAHSVSEATLYVWRQRFGGMNVDETRRLKILELENQRLKKLVVERDLEIEIMKEIAGKKW